MATAALACDDLSINRINPYTWSGTYGLYTDGFPNTMTIDGSWTTQIDETPTVYPAAPDDAYDQNMDLSGPMYLKTAEVDPAPFRGYPARKMEYADGRVTWYRPGAPWSFAQKETTEPQKFLTKMRVYFEDNTLLMLLVILALIYFFFAKKN
jgi:hypothetical protein